MEVFNLDWGPITPEGYDEENNQIIHVFNHNLEKKEYIQRSIIFIIGRIKFYKIHIPHGCSQKVVIDARGQTIIYSNLKSIKNKIIEILNDNIKIEFLQ